MFWRAFFLLAIRFPCPDFQESEHVHAVNVVEVPTSVEERIVGGIDIIVQRQAFAAVSAAFVGKSDSTSVVCVCTVINASAISCIKRSTG